MMNKSCILKRILVLVLVLGTLLGCIPALAEARTAIVNQEGLAVYTDAYLKKKAGNLESFTLVTVNAVKSNVVQLRIGGKTFYADTDNLVLVDEIAIPGVVQQSTRVYEEPDTLSRSAALNEGTRVNVLYVADEWAMLEKDGNLGYALVEFLTPEAEYEPEESVPEDTEDPFLPEEPEDDQDGDVTIETFAAQVSASSLLVYKSASTSSQKQGTLKKGQEVTVYAYNDGWAYIGLDGKYGFCKRSGLTRVKEEIEEEPEVNLSGAVKATVTAASVKVYKSASESSQKLGTLQKGAVVNLINTGSGWAYIELNGKYGYCAQDAITPNSDLTTEDEESKNDDEVIGDKSPIGTATVIEASAPVYASMSTSAKITATLKMGETLSFYGYDSKWVLVGRDGNFGFVPRKYLNADSYTELRNEDSGSGVLELENALLALGYLDGVPSSNYTNYTAEAVKRLQAALGMSQTGVADAATQRVLYSGKAPASPILSASLSSGSADANVKRLQTRLLALGYLSRSSSVDGDYGSTTAAAIRLFQSAAGISATGTADNATIRALYNASAPALPSGKNAADASTSTGSSSSGNSTDVSGGLASTTDQYIEGMSNAQKLEYVIYVAQQQLGKKYVFGATGMSSFDCSGLTMYCFKQIGISLTHSAYNQGYSDTYTKISSKSSLRRGDLVFFNTLSDGDQCDHVGIYLGNGYFIHASSGAAKVVTSSLDSGYYSRVFSWGRRVLST